MKCPNCEAENTQDSQFCEKCGAPLSSDGEHQSSFTKTLETPTRHLSRDTTFAERYEILELLGSGGMGEVYQARDTVLNEYVALKLIHPEITYDKKVLNRFRSELKLTRKITHENVCRMHELMVYEGKSFITMEYVEGKDLKSIIRSSKVLEENFILSTIRQVAEGLIQAHKLGIVHRDLKPQNIMIQKDSSVKIMDFGIARSLETRGVTEPGMIIGTPEYMSPEQAEGKETDQRSDIYSLGIILYEMVTGKVPFESDSVIGVCMKHKNEMPLHPQKINPKLSSSLSQIILCCLEKSPDDRYQSTESLLDDLEQLDAKLPNSLKKAPVKRPLVPFIFIPTAILAVFILLFFWRPWSTGSPEFEFNKPKVAVLYFGNPGGDSELDYFRDVLFTNLINDLSQSTFFSVLTGDRTYEILDSLGQLEATVYPTKTLREIASKGRVSHFVLGDYGVSGEDFWINFHVQDFRAGEIKGSKRLTGKRDDYLSMIDEITRSVKPYIGLTVSQIESDIDENLSDITSDSEEALRLYSEGRRLWHERNFEEAINQTKKALDIDPEFAMAYRSLWAIYGFLNNAAKQREFLQKASLVKHKLNLRERLLVEKKYEELLQYYPDDSIANSNLAVQYFNLGEYDKSIKHHQINLKNRPNNWFSRINIAQTYMAKGEYKIAENTLKEFLNIYGDNEIVLLYLAGCQIIQHRLNDAFKYLERAEALEPDPNTILHHIIRIRGELYLLEGDFIKAQDEFTRLFSFEPDPAHLWARHWMVFLFWTQGRIQEALNEVDLGIQMAVELKQINWAEGFGWTKVLIFLDSGEIEKIMKIYHEFGIKPEPYDQGLFDVKKGLLDDALQLAEKFREQIANKDVIRQRDNWQDYFQLAGLIDLRAENYTQAIENFNKLFEIYPEENFNWPEWRRYEHAWLLEPLAQIYEGAADIDKAIETYTRITQLTIGRLFWGHIYARSFYNLGRLYELKGEKKNAIKSYEKFIELWEKADPELQDQVNEARQHISALK